MTKDEEQYYYSDEMWKYIDDSEKWNQQYVDQLRANFDLFTLSEQTEFQNIIKICESTIDSCKLFKLAYEKYHRQQVLDSIYVVKEGDTLLSIANAFFGNPMMWKEIYRYNSLTDLDLSDVKTLAIPKITLDNYNDVIE